MAEARDPAGGERRRHRPLVFRHPYVVLAVVALLLWRTIAALSVWGDRTTLFFFGGLAAVVMVLLTDALLAVPWARGWRVMRSVAGGVAKAIATDPELDRALDSWPRFGGWVRRRLSTDRWDGAYLTTIVLACFVFLSWFASLGAQVLGGSELAAWDPGVSALLRAFRTPAATRVMWVATAVGDPWVVRSVAVLVIGLLFLVGKRAHALLLAGSVSSAAVLSALLKILFERPRPLPGFALIDLPGSFSFPSGHALSSLVFFGVLAFIGLRLQTATRQRFLIVSAALLAAGVIGISRVYLGVHWMTDVLGGWVLALAALTAWIGAFVTWERYGRPPKDRAPLVRGAAAVWLSGAAVAIALVLIAWGALQDPILASATQPPALKPLPVTEVRGGPPFLTPEAVALLPRVTVNPDGSAAEPVGIVFIGEKEQLLRAFAQAGWSVADPGTLGNILHTAAASMSGSPYPTAPVTPSFLDGRAQDLAFEKPEGAVTVKRRHHTRLWLTGFTAEGRPVWVGTASFDSRFEIGSAIPLPTHHIEPDIDAERDFIVRDLTTAGGLKRTQIVRVSPAKAGRNAEGDLFFTGGEAAVLTR